VFLAERRLIVGFLGMGAVSLNRPAMIDYGGPATGTRKLPQIPFSRNLRPHKTARKLVHHPAFGCQAVNIGHGLVV